MSTSKPSSSKQLPRCTQYRRHAAVTLGSTETSVLTTISSTSPKRRPTSTPQRARWRRSAESDHLLPVSSSDASWFCTNLAECLLIE
jgi:hypothetical protein